MAETILDNRADVCPVDLLPPIDGLEQRLDLVLVELRALRAEYAATHTARSLAASLEVELAHGRDALQYLGAKAVPTPAPKRGRR